LEIGTIRLEFSALLLFTPLCQSRVGLTDRAYAQSGGVFFGGYTSATTVPWRARQI
jgi:hypothetical protein